MFFSIIVPVYNVERYLEKCIVSLMEQDINDYEIILVNDGSTDNSANICEKFLNINNKIKVYSKINSGLSDTRNFGVKKAIGNYIMFVDSDDYIEKNILGILKKEIVLNDYPDVIYSRYYSEEDNKISVGKNYYSKVNVLRDNSIFLKEELLLRNMPIAACFGIYNRRLLLDNNLYFKSGILHEDERWSPEVLLNARKIYTSEIIYYHYTRHSGSITRLKDKTKNGLDLLETCKYLVELSENIVDDELKSLFLNRVSMVYMKAICIGKLYRNEYSNIINKKFPKKYAYLRKDKIKSSIFAINLRLYYLLDNIFG